METQELIFTNKVGETIDQIVAAINPTKLFVLVDVNTSSFVLPRLQMLSTAVGGATVITTKAGDINKNIDSLAAIWKKLGDEGATRSSMLINLGGGMITDMGAFAASTFKRGITFMNIPTTLLGAVDASVGGKTGINFNNLKNEVGVFRQAENVIISTIFFNTLPVSELRSGYAEMIKHALISSKENFDNLMKRHVEDISPDTMLELLEASVLVKKDIVDNDPTEKSIRRALNFGHTAGHAFESFAMERRSPIPHGYAVAYGMLTELVLSHMKLGFPSDIINLYANYVKEVYGPFEFTCDDYAKLLGYMAHDKKNNVAGEINFTLLAEIGDVKIDIVVSDDDIKNALDITRDLMGI